MGNCVCNATLSNTGTGSCPSVMSVTRKLVLAAAVNAAGDDFSLPIATLKDFALVEPLLNVGTADRSRLYPLPELENVEDLKDDTVFQTFNSGNRAKVREGFRTFTGYIPNGSTELLERIIAWGCVAAGAYMIDVEGNVVYSNRGDNSSTDAYPVLIDRNTFDARLVKSTDSEVQMIMITFQWKKSQKDEWLRIIPESLLNWNSDDLYGLIDLYGGTPSSISTTGFTIDVFSYNGTSETEPATGFDVADFAVYNVTDASAATVQTVTESPDGTYAITFTPAATSADVLRLSTTKDRYDSSKGLETVVITVP